MVSFWARLKFAVLNSICRLLRKTSNVRRGKFSVPVLFNEFMVDHRSYTHNLASCEIEAWKKFRPERDSNP